MKKMLMVGPASRHLSGYLELIGDYFGQIMVVTTSLMPEIDTLGCRQIVVDPSLKSLAGFYRTIIEISMAIKGFRPDVIHVQQAGTMALAVVLANRKYRRPLILTVMGSDVMRVPNQSPWHKKMVRYILGNADHITCDAEIAANAVSGLIEHHRPLTITTFGVPEIRNPEVPKERLIYSNRLHEPLYRIDKVVDMFHKFHSAGNLEWRLAIAGKGSQTTDLKKKVTDLGISSYVEFTGWLEPSDNFRYYNRASIYVSVPENDATAVSLLEAMSAGCLPVVSDLAANREWIQDGINGVVCRKGMVDPLDTAFKMDLPKVSEQNIELVKHRAGRKAARKNFIEIYHRFLKEQ